MSLLEGDSIEEEKRVVRGRMRASPTQGRARVADQGQPAGEPTQLPYGFIVHSPQPRV